MRAAIRATAILGTLMMTFVLSRELSAGVQDPTDGELRRLTDAYAQAWAKGNAKAVTVF